jgi:DNA-binding NarL/FixJ family response regulator
LPAEQQANTEPIRVLIADDHGLVRNGLRLMLEDEADMLVIGEAEDGTQALILVDKLGPDVILLDVSMPPPDGIEVARCLRDRKAGVRVLMLTMHEDSDLVREAREAGAAGYMLKRAAPEDLLTAIRTVAEGGEYIHPALTQRGRM